MIGLGNEQRGDDGVGVRVARAVAAAGWDGVEAVALGSVDPAALMAVWEGVHAAFLIDAVVADAPPGTILRLDARRHPLPAGLRTFSTHGLDLASAVELARALGMLPPRLVVYGIVGRSFAYGEGLTPAVDRAARRVVERLRRAGCRACTSNG
ncbi:MAG: hydrogenase maturation protease [Chloroflexi bacterium]|nr:hydrogenase maturation protease [Chloroflexota bacterium]